jgi:hypothetical protein
MCVWSSPSRPWWAAAALPADLQTASVNAALKMLGRGMDGDQKGKAAADEGLPGCKHGPPQGWGWGWVQPV